jgi:hypothetical protein
VKGNQPQLLEDIAFWFDSDPRMRQGDAPAAKQLTVGHGRLVTYELETTTALNDYLGWPGMQQVFRLRQVSRRPKTAEPQEQLFYGITSVGPERASPQKLLTLWREHWHIENGVHWVRDKDFEEDDSRARSGALPHALAILRNLVMNTLRIYGEGSIKNARTRLGADVELALGLLA